VSGDDFALAPATLQLNDSSSTLEIETVAVETINSRSSVTGSVTGSVASSATDSFSGIILRKVIIGD